MFSIGQQLIYSSNLQILSDYYNLASLHSYHQKLGAHALFPLTVALTKRFEDKLTELAESGRTPKLWVQYHRFVDTMRIFIRSERLAEWDNHLACYILRMIDIYAAAGRYQYAKGARLYCLYCLSLISDISNNTI